MYGRVHKKISSRLLEHASGCYTHFGLLSPEKFDFYLLDMMYIQFMDSFHLACWNTLVAVTLISAYWVQKRLIPTF